MNRLWLGGVEIHPVSVIAGSMNTLTLTYTVGKYGIDDGGSIRMCIRNSSDLEKPQFKNPHGSGYTTATTTGNVWLALKYGGIGVRPWKKVIQIDVHDGFLREGDNIVVVFGDKSEGGQGIRIQTFRELEHIIKVLVDPFGTGKYEEIEESTQISIEGGPAEKIQVVSPSDTVVGSPITVTVRALDSWGNLSDMYKSRVDFDSSDPDSLLPESHIFSDKDCGAKRFDSIVLNTPGLHNIYVKDDSGREAVSNPVLVRLGKQEKRLFWGDIHGQTKHTVGTGTLKEYFRFARDVAAIDFCGWQGNDFQITDEIWREVSETTRRFNEPGKFVTFLGYEWSGITPAGGDHNIYFLDDDEEINRSHQWLVNEKSEEETNRYPISELWKTFRGRKDVMAVAHIGGRPANLDYFDVERVPLIEVHSHHGTSEWFIEEALSRNLKVGFVANSDDHTCRPGLTYPAGEFSTRGGYMGVYASELTRKALWKALWNRLCYATTGERIILWVEVNGHTMGEEFESNKPIKTVVKVVGTAPLHEVEIKRGLETIYRHPFAKPKKRREELIKIEWSGVRGYAHEPRKVDWEGGLYIDRGRIISFSEFAFDFSQQGVKRISNQRLLWKSTTCGDPDGIILKLDAPDDSTIFFHSKPITFSIKLKDVKYEPNVFDAGLKYKKVKVSKISGGKLPCSLEFSFIDEIPIHGLNSYWVRVVQSDGNMAWSSPVFVNYKDVSRDAFNRA